MTSIHPQSSTRWTRFASIAALGLFAVAWLAPVAQALSFSESCFTDHISVGEATADFNEDGHLDVALSSASTPPDGGILLGTRLEVYLGHGDGTFGPALVLNAPSSFGILAFVAADADNDGHMDLVGANGNGVVGVWAGRGDGTFTSMKGYGVSQTPTGVAVGDFNGDGRADIASCDSADPNVAILLGTGKGGGFKARVSYPTGRRNRAITTADLNGDGALDIITANTAIQGPLGTTVSILLGNGDGSFGPPSLVPLPQFTGRIIASADFNLDGHPDIVLGSQNTGTSGAMVLLGNGDGTLAPAVYYETSPNGSDFTASLNLAVGDVNGDGRPDVAIGDRRIGPAPTFPLIAAQVTILLAQPNGSLAIDSAIPVTFGYGTALGDFNGDGRLDVASDGCAELQTSPAPAPAMASHPATGPAPSVGLRVAFAPNPLRESGHVEFTLPFASRVSLGLYDLRGRLVRTLVESEQLEAGIHSFALSRANTPLAPGVYFYRLLTPSGATSGRLVVTDR